MGGEAFLYPFLIVAVALISVILAETLRKTSIFRKKLVHFLLITFASPSLVLLLGLRDPNMVWSYVMFSVGLAAIISCSVAVSYALFRFPK